MALVLRRKVKEAILFRIPGIAEPMRISVTALSKDNEGRYDYVQLAIETDNSVKIMREELVRRDPTALDAPVFPSSHPRPAGVARYDGLKEYRQAIEAPDYQI